MNFILKFKDGEDHDIVDGHEVTRGISFIMKNGSEEDVIPYKVGQTYNTGKIVANLTLTAKVTDRIPFVYFACAPFSQGVDVNDLIIGTKNYGSLYWGKIQVPYGSKVAFPTLEEFIEMCNEAHEQGSTNCPGGDWTQLIKTGYQLTAWSQGGNQYAPGDETGAGKIENDTVYIAIWSEDYINYSITYNLGVDIDLPLRANAANAIIIIGVSTITKNGLRACQISGATASDFTKSRAKNDSDCPF